MSELTQEQREIIANQKLEDKAAVRAAATAKPGPLADIWSPTPEIKVGKYSIRPFYDLDFEFFQDLNHPFAAFAMGNADAIEGFVPRGPDAWQLIWVMTRPVAEVETAFQETKADGVKLLAKAEFGVYRLGALAALAEGVMKQLSIYASSVVGYEGNDLDEKKKDGQEASASRPPS
jgi:hypothetical protein